MKRILGKLLIAESRHPLLVLGAALAAAVFSILYTVDHLEFLTSQRALISSDKRLMRLSEQIDRFDDLDGFVAAIENRDDSRSLAFLHALASRLEADKKHYLQVFYRVDPERFKPWALFYMDRTELESLRDDLEEHREFIRDLSASPGLNSFFEGVNREMASRMIGELFTGFLDEGPQGKEGKPLDLGFLIRTLEDMSARLGGDRSLSSPWESFFTGSKWGDGSEEGYFWTENKRYLLLFVTPKKSDESFVNAQNALTALRNAIHLVQKDFSDVQAGVTGQEALNEDEMGIAFRDMSLATVVSLVSLLALLILFWKGIRRPLLEIVELLFALSWTFGLTTFFIGHLNILSVTFAPLLLGLGIDYGIHWLARYQEEERLRGGSKAEALKNTTEALGPGIVLAGATAALSFFPLVLSGFKGLMELGIITSIGMAMTTVTTLGVLPALVCLFDKFSPGTSQTPRRTPPTVLFRLTNKRALAFLVPGAAALGLSVWGASGVRFDLNMLHLQSKGAESVIWEKKLLDSSERSSMYGAVLADSLEEVDRKAASLKALQSVSEVQSIESMLPEDQEEKVPLLRALKPFVSGIGSLANPAKPVDLGELDRTLGKIRFKMLDTNKGNWGASQPLQTQMDRVRRLIDRIRGQLASLGEAQARTAATDFERLLLQDMEDKFDVLRTNATARPMRIEDLPVTVRERFINEAHRYLIRVFPSQDIWEPSILGRFVHDLRSVDPDAVGDPVTLYVFTKAFRDASIKAAVYAVIFILALLLVTFRNLFSTLLVLIPLVAGTAWTLGLMGLLGVDLNLANSIFMPLIVGAGVEYGIIIVNRWQQQGGAKAGRMTLPFSTAKGVVLAGLTTTVGFGSLTMSHHQGIMSLGLLAMIGSLSVLAAAVLFLPSILQVVTAFSGRPRRLDPAGSLVEKVSRWINQP